MRYTKNDIRNIPLTEFLAALGEKPVKAFGDMKLYYAPQRDDPEPMLVVDTNTNRWYDHATDQSGDIIDLATLKMNPNLYMDPRDFRQNLSFPLEFCRNLLYHRFNDSSGIHRSVTAYRRFYQRRKNRESLEME